MWCVERSAQWLTLRMPWKGRSLWPARTMVHSLWWEYSRKTWKKYSSWISLSMIDTIRLHRTDIVRMKKYFESGPRTNENSRYFEEFRITWLKCHWSQKQCFNWKFNWKLLITCIMTLTSLAQRAVQRFQKEWCYFSELQIHQCLRYLGHLHYLQPCMHYIFHWYGLENPPHTLQHTNTIR